ncbi:Auxin response factor 16 [Ananas comosus]|uniref:Auxin response factor 16 n=1 Tax=Ananas comosus TaxID=4615 RepID=A0A199W0R9_ANACO|nr:Auxin response factor 16 [Ananas comosus]
MAPPRLSSILQPPSAVDPRVWRACAGWSSRLPPIGSHVCYFPEGHAEHAWYPPDLSAVLGGGGAPFFRCRVVGGRLLANRRSDEVFSEIRLDPSPSAAPTEEAAAAAWSGGGEGDDGGMAWFVKILTESDANCGGGFSVPRSCAEHIFPPLNLAAEPPVQTLSISDLHGTAWKFCHIYRGTPRRHLLTTGWSKFAESKRLISGDAIIFVKDKSNGDLFVGFRRALRLFDADSPFLPFLAEIDPEEDERTISELGFSRCVRGRIPSANVVEAARSADLGRPFEVLYYPKAGLPEFVVPEAEVDAAMRVPWKVGMRVTLSVEGEDSSTMHNVLGTGQNLHGVCFR